MKHINRAFFNIAVSVDCVIFGYKNKQLKVLLIKSDLKEYEGLWSLLGNLVTHEEDIEEAAYRVLQERTGLQDVYLEQVHTFGKVDRHPSGRVVTTAYYSLVDISHKLRLSHNELHWHAVKDVGQLAFDHKTILKTCVKKLSEQIIDHPVAFNLLPEKFSLRELQDLYEAILGVSLDRRNFRKRITLKNWLVDLNIQEEDVPHRPGKLYKFKTQLKKSYQPFRSSKSDRIAV
ncbi:MAG: NUDIX domain-containing protein [Chitinophagaceae bacterium]